MSAEGAPLGSTYRLQLFGVGFVGARKLVGYLAALGIETLFVSPILVAAPGSTHGYDVIDPTRLDPALGTPEEFEALLSELDSHRMRLLIDIVPNHMATGRSNWWWWDVLRAGRESGCAAVYDIDWSQHGGRVLVPTLSGPLADVAGTARMATEDGERVLVLDGQTFPLRAGARLGKDVVGLLEHEHYRPSYWKLSNQEINYRRFFDIDGLVGVRVEDPDVFARTHDYILGLGHDDRIAGWRVDHIDGLSDPRAYATRLRDASKGQRQTRPVVLVEKIVAPDEDLPGEWAVDGTTGYEFADLCGALFVDPRGAHSIACQGQTLTGEDASFADMSLDGKGEVLAMSFPAPLSRLGRIACGALDDSRPGHDLSAADIECALAALTVHLDAYRTYIDQQGASRADRARIVRASAAAMASGGLGVESERALRLITDGLLGARRGHWLELAQRWQQLTGAVMAKGVEDTATYRYSGLLGHADVGCDPDRIADPERFHRLARQHLRRPQSLNATSTHDSKRSEDARARLFTLSEVPDEWGRLVERWHRRYRNTGAPDPHDQLVCFQTLIAMWPFGQPTISAGDRRRVRDYMVKAAREAKRRTSWTEPDPNYERSLTGFVNRLGRDAAFAREMARFVARIGPAAATNSLSMLALKMVTPGVPDLYQGMELWESALTDPDNRRPVDFDLRAKLLAELPSPDAGSAERRAAAKELLTLWPDGRLKLFVTRALLHLRRANPLLFSKGTYRVLSVSGPLPQHVVGIERRLGSRRIIAVVPRLMVQVAGPGPFPTGERVWGTTALQLGRSGPEQLSDVFTGASIDVRGGRLGLAACLSPLPIAVLASPALLG